MLPTTVDRYFWQKYAEIIKDKKNPEDVLKAYHFLLIQ